jgi:hypothetical protein
MQATRYETMAQTTQSQSNNRIPETAPDTTGKLNVLGHDRDTLGCLNQ